MSGNNVIDIEAARSKRKKSKKKKKEKKPLSPRKKQQIKRKLMIYLLVAGFLILTLGYSTYKIISLKIEENQLQKKQEQLKEERDNLKEEAENVKSPEYIEKEARKQLHLLLPGEILYMLPGEEDSNGDK